MGRMSLKQVVKVQFQSGYKNYEYFSDLELVKGDWVCVKVYNGTLHCVKVVQVHSKPPKNTKANKWVLCRVPEERYGTN